MGAGSARAGVRCSFVLGRRCKGFYCCVVFHKRWNEWSGVVFILGLICSFVLCLVCAFVVFGCCRRCWVMVTITRHVHCLPDHCPTDAIRSPPPCRPSSARCHGVIGGGVRPTICSGMRDGGGGAETAGGKGRGKAHCRETTAGRQTDLRYGSVCCGCLLLMVTTIAGAPGVCCVF